MALPVVETTGYAFQTSVHKYDGVLFYKSTPSKLLDDIKKMEFYQDDILVSSHMKSGTTWMAEIVDLLKSDLNLERAKNTDISLRAPFLELLRPPYAFEQLTQRQKGVHGSSVVKTHLLPHFFKRHLEDGSLKVIHVYRNPKDVLVSYHNMCIMTGVMADEMNINSWDDLFERLLDDELIYSNSVDHVLEWWQYKDYPNVLLVSYEDLKEDHVGQIKRISEFLGYKYTDEDYAKIAKETSFDVMKDNPMVNFSKNANVKLSDDHKFMRKGVVGDWKNHFTVRQNELMDELIAEKLKNSDLVFKYE